MPVMDKGKVTKGAPATTNAKKGSTVRAKTLDDFLTTWSDDDDCEDDSEESVLANGDTGQDDSPVAEDGSDPESIDVVNDGDSEDNEELDDKGQKEYLSNLAKTDPEFYKFLKEEDEELLNFDKEDSEDENDNCEEKVHKLPQKLEVASDESDFESEDEEEQTVGSSGDFSVTNKMIDEWTDKLKSSPTVTVIASVVGAFRSAVDSVAGVEDEEEDNKKQSKRKKAKSKPLVVKGGTKFNAVIRMCLCHLAPALGKVLKVDLNGKSDPQKSKMWPKLNKQLKIYSSNLVKLVATISSASVQSALLKHVHTMVPLFAILPKCSKSLLRTLISLWSSHKEENIRIIAYMSVLRLTRCTLKFSNDEASFHSSLLEPVLKQMYMAYIRNVKFTSPTTWPNINFMRRSLAEIFNLDPAVCYRYTFIYIRQLAIQLRNATMQGSSSKSKGKDVVQTVYNWQYIHSLHLWVQLLCDSYPTPVLEPLIYPLIQVIVGTIKLVYTPTFYPLRFSLAKLLTQISSKTGKFIPVLPYYLDVLNNHNFDKKTTKVSMKPMDFSCILRLSKSQMTENGFKDAVVEQVYEGLLENLHSVSHKISFPEISVPVGIQLRAFVKKCRVSNFVKKIRQVLDKMNENTEFVLGRRRKIRDFGVTDLDKIRLWEANLKNDGTPLSTFYNSWKSISSKETMKKITQQEKLDDYYFIPRPKVSKPKKEAAEFKGIFGEDDDANEDDLERFHLKEERGNSCRKEEEAESSTEEEAEVDEDEDGDEEPMPKKKRKADSRKKVARDEAYVSSEDEENVEDEVKDFDMDDYGSDFEEDGDDGGEANDDNSE